MCIDANAGARAAARERAARKDALFAQEGLKFFNRETQLARAQNRNIVGYSRDLSDAYAKAIAAQGKGRLQLENATRRYFRTKGTVNEGGRARAFGKANYQGLLAAQSEVESVIDNVLRRNLAYAEEGSRRKFLAQQASAREALGIPAAYGAPVMMPPTNRLGGALQIASQVASIYSGFGGEGLFKFGSAGSKVSEFSSSNLFSGGLTGSALGNSPFSTYGGLLNTNPFSFP